MASNGGYWRRCRIRNRTGMPTRPHRLARGIMQFTEDTAKRYNVDRLDPRSSILGGARYLSEPNARRPLLRASRSRTKPAGAGGLATSALVTSKTPASLTQRAKKNPDMWPDVRRHLPLLTKPDVAAQFKLGLPCKCRSTTWNRAVLITTVLLRLEPPYQPKVARKNGTIATCWIHYTKRSATITDDATVRWIGLAIFGSGEPAGRRNSRGPTDSLNHLHCTPLVTGSATAIARNTGRNREIPVNAVS